MEKALTKEIVESLKLINQIHLKSAIHLISGNILMTRCSMDAENIIRMCEKLVLQVGVSCFVYALPEDTISDTTISCGLTTKADLISLINEIGIRRFLKEKIPTEILKDYCSAMGKNFDNAYNHSEMVDYVSDEIMLYGMENWLDQFPRKLLEDWCNNLNIDVLSHESDAALIDSIMVKIFNLRKQELDLAKSLTRSELVEEVSQSDETDINKSTKKKRKKSEKVKGKEADGDWDKQNVKDEELERKAKKRRSKDNTEYSPGSDFSDDPKKKKNRKLSSSSLVLSEITKNTTREDLTAYILKDLQQYCRENSISYIGRKSELISRIITFLETGEKPHKRKYTKRKREYRK
jgi:hypothetical protein